MSGSVTPAGPADHSSTPPRSSLATAREDAPVVWPGQALSFPREIAFIFVVCMAQCATQWGLAISIVPLHIIGEHYGIANEPGRLSWMPAAFSLTVGTFILIAGRMGDLYGHKRLFVLGWLWYALWSLLGGVAAYAPNEIFFDVCRAMQGIGPAFLLPNGLAILGRSYPPGRRKEMMFALFGLAAPSGFVFGAIFSSLFSQFTLWPWSYWANAIASVAFAVISIPVVPALDEYNPLREEEGHLDLVGCITGVVGLVLVNFAWNQGPVEGWNTVYVYVLLIVGVAFIGGFFFNESRATHPLVPIKALSKEIVLVLGAIAAGWASFGGHHRHRRPFERALD